MTSTKKRDGWLGVVGFLVRRFGIRVGMLVMVVSALTNSPQSAAQTVTGTILGTVRDPGGAVIAGASMTAKSTETGLVRTATTGPDGAYIIVSVPAGPYAVTASAPGFKTELREGLTLTVGGELRAEFTLTIGTVDQTVQVTGEAPQVDTSSSTISSVVQETTIRELPLNGRDWLQLAILQSGVVQAQAQGSPSNSHGMGKDMSISGGRPTQNVYRIDGMVVNDESNFSPGGVTGANLGVDAIQEFSVLTNVFSAEYGRSSGGVVNAITKSGTNGLHGSAFEFLRNDVLDARNYFDPSQIPPFRRNQFGASAGGPIKKDKLFFFAAYEGLRQYLSQSLSTVTLSPNAMNGILCANTSCSTTTTVTINPKIKTYVTDFFGRPLAGATPGSTLINGNTETVAFTDPTITPENYVIGRVDYRLNDHILLTGTYTFDNGNSGAPDAFRIKTTGEHTGTQRVMFSLQDVFSPTVVNTIRAGFNRVKGQDSVDTATSPLATDLTLGFVPNKGVGEISVTSLTPLNGVDAAGANYYAYTDPQFDDDLSWTKGRNNIRIGFSVEALGNNVNAAGSPTGVWQFTSIQNFLTDVPSQFSADLPTSNDIRALRTKVFGAYFQDDLRVNSKLTLNLGLRYEPQTVLHALNGLNAKLENLTDAKVTTGQPFYENNSLRNFDPRVGFAWDPFGTGKTAVRSGFGIFAVDTTLGMFDNRSVRSAPFFLQGVLKNPPASSFPNGAESLLGLSSLRAAYVQNNPRAAYKMQWNLDVQHEISRGLSLTVAYVGSKGVHIPIALNDIDQVPPSLVTMVNGHLMFPTTGTIQIINPNFSQINALSWYGYQIYHALQVTLNQQFRHGFAVHASYVWSKNIDIGSEEYVGSDLGNAIDTPYAFEPQLNRGPADFNVPQNLLVNFEWDVPSPHTGGVVSRFLLSGWEFTGISTIQSGSPFSVQFYADRARTGDAISTNGGGGGGQRPNYVPGPGCPQNGDAINQGNFQDYVKVQCFAFPALGQLGSDGRNTLTGPGLEDFDFSLFKNNTLFHEKLKVQFRTELFNIFNRANLVVRAMPIFDGSGNILSTAGHLQGPTATTARQVQFGLKLLW